MFICGLHTRHLPKWNENAEYEELIVSAIAALACFGMSAQEWGDMYLGVALGTSNGRMVTETSSTTQTGTSPMNTTFSGQVEFGIFALKNLRVSVGLGVPYARVPKEVDKKVWLYTQTTGFQVNPGLAYYVRLADRFYYTPEVGFISDSCLGLFPR